MGQNFWPEETKLLISNSVSQYGGCVHKRVKIDRDLLKFIAKIMRLLKKRGSVKVMLKVSYGVCKFTFKKGAKKVKVMTE